MHLPLIIVGGGGHARVLASALLLREERILGFVDQNPSLPPLFNLPCLGDDSCVFPYPPDQVCLVNGVGSIDSTLRRRKVYEKFQQSGYAFESVIHPSAIVAPDVHCEEGVQIMAGAIVQTGSRLGANVIVNTGARVDHDCRIDDHAHIAPGVTLSGNVHVGAGAHIGTGATIIQGARIGRDSLVGAGAVVLHDVPEGVTVAGVPAAPLVRQIGH